MNIKPSAQLNKLPPYLFVDLDRKKKEAIKRGVDIISLGIGDPDLPTPPHIIEAGQKALAKSSNHRYPLGPGSKTFRDAVASWYSRRFGVTLNSDTDIHALIGSKEGIGHMMLGLVNPGDYVLIPEPGYPVYNAGTILANGNSYFMPLKEEHDYILQLDAIPQAILKKSKIIFLNYPNNPTTATAKKSLFEKAIVLAKKYNIVIAHDAAYSELYYGTPPFSFLSIPGAREVGVEFHSLSKTYCMTGWRIGWICGNPEVVKIVGAVKDNYDSGVFEAIQEAGVAALTGSQDCVDELRLIYKRRRDVLCKGLQECGWNVRIPEATFYVWAKTPHNLSSKTCTEKLLEEAGIMCTPGTGMGPSGEGYVRFSLTSDVKRIEQAIERIAKITW